MSEAPIKSLRVQDLPRVNEISFVLARNGFGHVLSLLGLRSRAVPTDEPPPSAPFARRLRQVLVELGPTFVKLGQVLSVRPDIVPRDLQIELETLQDDVQPMPFDDVRAVLEDELQRPLEEVFEEFEEKPIGSASIAQVHRARLVGGQEVAVKLQRRGIERTIRSDLHILYSLAQLLEGNVELPGVHTPTAIIREFDAAINQELDFLRELANAERLRSEFLDVPDIVIPKVLPRWSTRRVLVMELVEGRPLGRMTHALPPADAHRLAHVLLEATYRQVFEFGFFHGDPHPGNLLLTDSGKLVILDFGVVGTLTGAMQDTLLDAFTSLVFRDAETLARTLYRAGAVKGGRVDLRELTNELERKMHQYHGASLDEMVNPATLMDLVQLCTRFRITLPPELAVLSRAATLIEALVRTLLPGVDIVREVEPYARRLITRRFSPDRLAQDTARMMLQMQGHLRDLPTQINQFMMDLEGGTITVVTRDPDAARLREEIRAGVLRLSLALLASTVTLGALLFLAIWSPTTTSGVPLAGVLGTVLLLLGGLLFGALGIHVLFARSLDPRRMRRRALALIRFFAGRRDR